MGWKCRLGKKWSLRRSLPPALEGSDYCHSVCGWGAPAEVRQEAGKEQEESQEEPNIPWELPGLQGTCARPSSGRQRGPALAGEENLPSFTGLLPARALFLRGDG